MTSRSATWGKVCLAARLAVLVPAVSIAQAGSAPAAVAPTAKAARETLLQADRTMSAAALLADGLASDGILLYEGAPVLAGRAKVLALLKSQPELSPLRVQWQPLVVLVSSDGSLGATWGITAISSASKPDSALRFGKYISAWRRGAGPCRNPRA